MHAHLLRTGKFAGLLAVHASFLLWLGCGGPAVETGTISGRVTHHGGKPLTNAVVHFLAPQLGSGCSADLALDGTYKVEKPLKAGAYQVQVTAPEVLLKPEGGPPPQPVDNPDIPRKAQAFNTSQLTVTIKAGKNEYNVDLTD